ncbi:MAG: hypothetical protein M3076_04150 [Actinomycetota bacterium]|nr:hypothetical protein [Actinomycetota bacterium]
MLRRLRSLLSADEAPTPRVADDPRRDFGPDDVPPPPPVGFDGRPRRFKETPSGSNGGSPGGYGGVGC